MKNKTLNFPSLAIRQGTVLFREGTLNDIEAMDRQWFTSDLPGKDDELTPEIIEASRRYWFSLLKNGDILIVGELEGDLVGRLFVNVKDRQSAKSQIRVDHPTGIIERVKVSIEHQGIGRALIENAEQLLLETGLSAAEMGVHQDNHRALAIYQRLGYKQLISNHEEPTAPFEGFITYRYQRPTAVLFKYLL